MKILVRIEPNGSTYIDKQPKNNIDYSIAPYNFTEKTIDDTYSDCISADFNGLEFSIDKYTARKHKEEIEPQIAELKQKLADTDYQAIKHSEGLITDEEYESIKTQRQQWRDEINKLEEE